MVSLLISEMAAYYYDKGMSLYEGLQELYKKYGYFKEKTISLTLKGIEGLAKVTKSFPILPFSKSVLFFLLISISFLFNTFYPTRKLYHIICKYKELLYYKSSI